MSNYMTTPEAAKALNRSTKTLYGWVARGNGPVQPEKGHGNRLGAGEKAAALEQLGYRIAPCINLPPLDLLKHGDEKRGSLQLGRNVIGLALLACPFLSGPAIRTRHIPLAVALAELDVLAVLNRLSLLRVGAFPRFRANTRSTRTGRNAHHG